MQQWALICAYGITANFYYSITQITREEIRFRYVLSEMHFMKVHIFIYIIEPNLNCKNSHEKRSMSLKINPNETDELGFGGIDETLLREINKIHKNECRNSRVATFFSNM